MIYNAIILVLFCIYGGNILLSGATKKVTEYLSDNA